MALLPGTPTLNEQGVPFHFVAWGGLFAPAGTPMQIVNRLNQESIKALRSPDIQERLGAFGLQAYGSSPEKFAEIIRSDLARIAEVVKAAGIPQE